MDWVYNPDHFVYKKSEEASTQIIKTSDVSRFKVGDFLFVSHEASIEVSPVDVSKLDMKRNPSFENKTVFLRLLLDGQIDLYEYSNKSKSQFFYAKDDGPIQPLIYKKYIINGKISENLRFRQQLVSDLPCDRIHGYVKNVDYNRKDLLSYFQKLNDCLNSDTAIYIAEGKSPRFFISPVFGIGLANLNVDRGLVAAGAELSGIEYAFGANFEYNFSFNNYKWAAVSEVFYRTFNDEQFVDNGGYDADLQVNYNSINFFLGIKHYLFLSNNLNLFLHGGPSLDFPSNSEVLFANTNRAIDPILEEFDPTFGLRLGVGLDYNNKLSIGLNYESRALTGEKLVDGNYDLDWNSKYNSLNMKIGYKIF